MTTLIRNAALCCLALILAFAPATNAADYTGDPYALNTCPVSGKELGSMGDSISIVVEGREVKVCCAGCKKPVEAMSAEFKQKLDDAMIAMQKAHYPLETCAVSGAELGSMGDPINMVVGNRHVKLCCAGCTKKAEADPAAIIAKLDDAVIAKQSESYKLTECVISGATLKADATNVVIANQLVKTCCGNCAKKVKANPSEALSKVATD